MFNEQSLKFDVTRLQQMSIFNRGIMWIKKKHPRVALFFEHENI
jgi:hypothetical protein